MSTSFSPSERAIITAPQESLTTLTTVRYMSKGSGPILEAHKKKPLGHVSSRAAL